MHHFMPYTFPVHPTNVQPTSVMINQNPRQNVACVMATTVPKQFQGVPSP